MCGWQVKLCDPLVTRVAISERFRDKQLMYKALYKFAFFTLLYGSRVVLLGVDWCS